MRKIRESKYSKYFKVGDKYNSWTITGPVVMQGEAKVHVTCNCGYSTVTSCYAIVKETSKGCSLCDQKKRLGQGNYTWKGYEEVPGSFIQRFIRKSNQRQWRCEIDAKFVFEIYCKQGKRCALTGLPIEFNNLTEEKKGYSCTASLDRIDSKKGYTKDNVQLVHKDVNLMKNAFSQPYFIQMCSLICEYQKKSNK